MKRLHLAFFVTPLFACVIPTLSVVETFLRRGYRITYVTSARFAAKVSGLGAQVVLCSDFPTRAAPFNGEASKRTEPAIGRNLVDLAEKILQEVTPFYEVDRPHAIVYDLVNLAGRVLASRWQLETVQLSPAFLFDKEHLTEQLPRPEHMQAVLDDGATCDLFLQRYGIHGNTYFYRDKLNVFFFPEEFQLPGTSSDGTFFYAPRCIAEQPYERTWQPPAGNDRPIALVSTSTYYAQGLDYFKMCIDAMADLDWYVVIAIGGANDPASFGVPPPNVEVTKNLTQIQILAHSSLLVCLAGMSTTVEAMYHGVPLLMLTQGVAEPELYADNNVRVGVGRHLTKAATSAESIRRAIMEIPVDTALIEQVRRVQRSVQRSPGPEETVNRIVEYLGIWNTRTGGL